jgi:hypothetical protein
MAAPNPSPRPNALVLAIGLCATLGAATLAYLVYDQGQRVAALTKTLAAQEMKLEDVYGEIVRIRIEQKSDRLGPDALMEKLRVFAPLLVSARTTEPDFKSAQKEMDAVLRAFQTMGEPAWVAIEARLKELNPAKNFDEIKWLLEAAERVNKPKALEIVKDVLLGLKYPNPRLRWYAASMLIDYDKPLAQETLRRVLSTESSRGINMERAQVYGASIPDKNAFATTGFNNFVQWYVRSEDPQMETTLLMVIGRSEHDTVTIQECIEVLGKRKCAAAVGQIEQLCENPPGQFENPIFQNKCYDALVEIQGAGARRFLEAQLEKATSQLVKDHIKELLKFK